MEKRHNPAGFDYEIIAQKKEYALIKMESTEEYKIVSDICADGSWAYTVCSWMYGKYGREEYLVMQDAIDSFRYKTESDYIPRSRLEELATQWKDKIIQCPACGGATRIQMMNNVETTKAKGSSGF